VRAILFCPVTSQVKSYPFEVVLPDGLGLQGGILSDQLKSLDWRVRKARRIRVLAPEILEETIARILALADRDEAR
jgi:mRNA interferase MazF